MPRERRGPHAAPSTLHLISLAPLAMLLGAACGVVAGCAADERACEAHAITTRVETVPFGEAVSLPQAKRAGATDTEVRVGLRVIYVWEPTGDAGFLTDGHGAGLGVCYHSDFGSQLEGDVSVEFVLAQGQHEDAAGQAGVSRFALAGFRWLDHYGGYCEPYLSFGAGYYAFEASGGSSVLGGGLYAGGGVELLVSRAFSATAEVIVHSVWDEDSSGASQVVVGAAAFSLRF